MTKQTNNIAEIRRKKKITQQQLADKLGVHVITVSKLERGVMQLTGSWLERLSEALDAPQMDIWGGFQLFGMDASARLHDGERIEVVDPEENRFSAFRNPLGDFDAKWIHVQDDTMLPFFGEGDLLQFTLTSDREMSVIDQFRGRLCMYNLAGETDLFIGTIHKVHSEKMFDIKSMNGRTMKNVEIEYFWFLSGYVSTWGVVAHFDTSDLGKKT